MANIRSREQDASADLLPAKYIASTYAERTWHLSAAGVARSRRIGLLRFSEDVVKSHKSRWDGFDAVAELGPEEEPGGQNVKSFGDESNEPRGFPQICGLRRCTRKISWASLT